MKKILHLDLDAFFASVEEMDNPSLKDKPVIVGGKSDRSVVSTCNYNARKFGIHSAMPIFKAKSLCPEGIYLKNRKNRYKEVSNQIFDIFYSTTEKVQKVSIDEAYIDVTDLYQSPLYIAKYIKKKVKDEFGITLSVGISYNKFLAKLASDWNKPDGIKVITKEMIPDILLPLEVDEIHGIGKKSKTLLNDRGIFTVKDLLKYSEDNLVSILGNFGKDIYERIRGIDNRKFNEKIKHKSIGTEITLKKDTFNKKILLEKLYKMNNQVFQRLKQKDQVAKTIIIKVKYYDFNTITRSKTFDHHLYNKKDYNKALKRIFDSINIEKSVRLIGITYSNISQNTYQQLSFLN